MNGGTDCLGFTVPSCEDLYHSWQLPLEHRVSPAPDPTVTGWFQVFQVDWEVLVWLPPEPLKLVAGPCSGKRRFSLVAQPGCGV